MECFCSKPKSIHCKIVLLDEQELIHEIQVSTVVTKSTHVYSWRRRIVVAASLCQFNSWRFSNGHAEQLAARTLQAPDALPFSVEYAKPVLVSRIFADGAFVFARGETAHIWNSKFKYVYYRAVSSASQVS